MFLRSTVIEAQPARIERGIAVVRDRVLPAVLGLEGSLGLTMLVDTVTGWTATSTLWGTRAALDSSRAQLTAVRAEAAAELGGEPLVEHWEVADLYRARGAAPGFASRSTRLEYDPGDAEQLVDVYRTTTVPSLALIAGFASAALLIDLDAGTGVSVVTFDSWRSLEDSRRMAAEVRRTSLEKAHARATEVVEAELVLTEMRLPDQA